MYNGKLGESISLPCNTTPTTGDDQVALLLFYKEDAISLDSLLPSNTSNGLGPSSVSWSEHATVMNKKVQPIYSLDARESPLSEAAQFAGQPLDGRATVHLPNHNRRSGLVWLRIERLAPDDAGLYRCRVDYRRGRTINWLINLQVSGTSSLCLDFLLCD
jgi:hypothetical protein